MSCADFSVINGGSIMILNADTDAAREWVDENIPDDAMLHGPNGTVIEPRYFDNIIAGITGDGLTVE